MKKLKNFLLLRWDWLKVPDNRRNLYAYLRVLTPVLVATGLFTNEQISNSLDIVAAILFIGGTTVAKRNVK